VAEQLDLPRRLLGRDAQAAHLLDVGLSEELGRHGNSRPDPCAKWKTGFCANPSMSS
jgi:hypothetical protein